MQILVALIPPLHWQSKASPNPQRVSSPAPHSATQSEGTLLVDGLGSPYRTLKKRQPKCISYTSAMPERLRVASRLGFSPCRPRPDEVRVRLRCWAWSLQCLQSCSGICYPLPPYFWHPVADDLCDPTATQMSVSQDAVTVQALGEHGGSHTHTLTIRPGDWRVCPLELFTEEQIVGVVPASDACMHIRPSLL